MRMRMLKNHPNPKERNQQSNLSKEILQIFLQLSSQTKKDQVPRTCNHYHAGKSVSLINSVSNKKLNICCFFFRHKILRKIRPRDAELMGFAKGDQPCWMIWTVIPVIPPPERPTMTVSPQRRGEDDLTYALFNLFKANQELDKKIKQGCHASQISPSYELLQFRVATYANLCLRKPF